MQPTHASWASCKQKGGQRIEKRKSGPYTMHLILAADTVTLVCNRAGKDSWGSTENTKDRALFSNLLVLESCEGDDSGMRA